MKKTQEKILTNAIIIFNRTGVGSARLKDIASECNISLGNLSYHYKTKKDLIQAVLEFMQERFSDMNSSSMSFFEKKDFSSLIKNYLSFQIAHRFFYRDILEIKKLIPDASSIYKNQMRQIVNVNENCLFLAVGKGLLIPEPHDGHYQLFAKNALAILNSWLLEREALGKENVKMRQVFLALSEFHYPYFTDKGKALYQGWKRQLTEMTGREMELVN